jgi:hypothetical protein
VRHESLLSGTVATLIFVVFQISDLSDSLSALMAGILILFPMHYRGAVMSSIWRVVGVVLGCLYILVVQLILYDHSSHMLLMMPLIGLGLAFGARLHVMEKVGRAWGSPASPPSALCSGRTCTRTLTWCSAISTASPPSPFRWSQR